MRISAARPAIALFALAFSLSVHAQTAALSGTVTDANKGLIEGTEVTLTHAAQNAVRKLTTDSQGRFAVPILPPGEYRIDAAHPGFRPASVPSVILRVGDHPQLAIQLQLTSVQQSVTVDAAGALLQTESSTVGTLVDRRFVENMPLNGRSFQSLIQMTAGVVSTNASSSGGGQFAVNGQRSDGNTFMVDGASANSSVNNTFGIGAAGTGNNPGTAANGGFNTLVSVDNLQEFKVQTSGFAPEYGRSPGAQVSIVTRSGSNRFTGSLFNYFRNTVLDANNWFNNANGLPRAPQQQNDFGGVFGGPAIKDKLFFFYSYEGLRLRQPTTGSMYVPSLAARQTTSSLQPILQAFPLPNGIVNPADPNTALFNGTWSNPTHLDNNSIRVDYTPNARMTLFGRYQHAPSEVLSRGGNNTASVVTTTWNTSKSLTLGHTYMASPTATNDLRFNATWSGGGQVSAMDTFAGATPALDSYLFPTGYDSSNSMLSAPLTNGSTLRTGTNVNNPSRHFNLIDSFALVKGAHQFKFGFDYRRLNPTLAPRLYDMQVTLRTSANYTRGIADSVRLQGKLVQEYLFQNYSAYAQDIWKATRRLTITYGVRWDVNPAPTSPNGRPGFVVTNFAEPISNISVLSLGPDSPYPTTWRNFSPRLGIAYHLRQDSNWGTVLRGGYGIFFDTANSASASWQGPYNAQRTMNNVAFPLTPANAAKPEVPALAPFITTAPVPNLKSPYVHQMNLTVEQSLGASQTLTASYVGAIGRRLLLAETFQVNSPVLTSLTAITNNATSDYHAFQAQFQRRLSRGLQVISSYTWSHSLDNASGPITANGNAFQPGFLARNRANSDFDVRHLASAAVSYNIPSAVRSGFLHTVLGNWSTDLIYRFSGGTPFEVNGNNVIDPATGTTYISRPNVNAGVPLWIDGNYPGGRRVNIAAFSAAPAGAAGNLGRNVLRGFSAQQTDLAVRRDFPLAERFRLQFRADFFNLLNKPVFGNPPVVLGQPATFGVANAMLSNSLASATSFSPLYQIGAPRSVQLSLKLVF
ncbi:MAG TPA: TonB-dependent receptor [Bryobacteraceae bacterium]|nr:TonB-dependent receptor [Bryobacteraceae bacterium]